MNISVVAEVKMDKTCRKRKILIYKRYIKNEGEMLGSLCKAIKDGMILLTLMSVLSMMNLEICSAANPTLNCENQNFCYLLMTQSSM